MESHITASPMYPVDALTPFLDGARNAAAQAQSRRAPRRSSRQPLRGAARFLRRASGRGLMLREPSVRVREAAAQQLEERQSDWAYSKPVIALDMLWNAAFVGIAIAVLALSAAEDPSVPLRVWIIGYAFQCAVHMACVVAEYRRRLHEARLAEMEASRGWESGGDLNSNSGSGSDAEDYAAEDDSDDSLDGNRWSHVAMASA